MPFTPALPEKLQDVFQSLSQGRHISAVDGALYSSLVAEAELYREVFAALGYTMVYDQDGFFYFDVLRKNQGQGLAQGTVRIALFIYILIDHLSNSSKGIESGMYEHPTRVDTLPHIKVDRYQSMMRQADISTAEDMERLFKEMERFGFIKREPGEIRFLAPARRFTRACEEITKSYDVASQAAQGELQA